MNQNQIIATRTEDLRREGIKLCHYMDAYVNAFTKNYPHLQELLAILDNLQEFYEEIENLNGIYPTEMKRRLSHIILLVRMRMYYTNKIFEATEEYNHEVFKVPVFNCF